MSKTRRIALVSTLIVNTATKLRTSLRNKERLVTDIFAWSVREAVHPDDAHTHPLPKPYGAVARKATIRRVRGFRDGLFRIACIVEMLDLLMRGGFVLAGTVAVEHRGHERDGERAS